MTATQALITLTPNKPGGAAFLAVPAGQARPSTTEAVKLLAYRSVSFIDTNAELIQFALSLTAEQNASGAVSSSDGTDENTVLQPSTKYNVLMYEEAKSSKIIGSFTTLSYISEGLFSSSSTSNAYLGNFTLSSPYLGNSPLSSQNFEIGTDRKFTMPFVISWIFPNPLLIEIVALDSGGDTSSTIANSPRNNNINLVTADGWEVNALGNFNRGMVFFHSPNSSFMNKFKMTITNGPGATASVSW